MIKLLGVLLLLTAVVGATYLNIDEPIESKGMMENSPALNIGIAGPGQTVYIVAERATIGPDDRIHDPGWDQLVITDVPPGWSTEDSPLYETPMKAKIKIAPDATDGAYTFKATAVNEDNVTGLGNLTVNIILNVSKNVFTIDVTPNEVETGVGEPAIYYIDIDNAGAASDTFSITSSGLPAWRFTKDVLAPHAINPFAPARKTIPYEVVSNEETDKEIYLNVTSQSSDQITKELKVRLKATPSLISDYRATAHGLLIFPLIENPIYSLIAFLSKLIL
ncbi:hypothetical protein H0N99_00865 [Candidatus Micrarchaeota archaeon]|nr:hypothetical protein [Candidatus Micrarchaeota archaeon]